MPTYIVFLDFDGVLHPGLAGTFVYLPLFSSFLTAHPEIAVVLSTSWRQDYALSELQKFFVPSLRNRIIGTTPTLSDTLRCQRYAEIQQWLASHPAVTHWAALDDDLSLFPAYCDNLVRCDPARGLRKAQLVALATQLGLEPGNYQSS